MLPLNAICYIRLTDSIVT